MYFLGVFQNIGDTIEQALRTFMGQIAAILYSLIESMYVLFSYLAKAEIIDNDFIAAIYRKVGLLLGLFMVFKLSFSLIQSLINPEKLTDKKNGFASIIGRCILSIVLLGITPSLFREAFNIQNYIVGSNNQNNIIYKLVVGKAVSGNFEDLGRVLASDLYFTFFTDDDGNLNKGIKDIITDNDFEYYDRFKTDNYDNLVESVENKEMSFDDTLQYLTVKENGKYVIEFNWLLSLSFGIVFIYLMFSYCIQTAVRVIQLAYLQLIAPVPILSYISDPDGAFKKWLKQCSTTFLDLFIRLSIIYFSMYVIDDVIEQFSKSSGIIFESTGVAADDTLFKSLIKIFIILGLLIFAKRVPELLKDLFPNLGGGPASLGFGPKLPKEVSGFAKGAATFGLGAVVGGAAGLATGIKHGEGIKGKIAGAFGGLGRGLTSARTKGNIFKNAQAGMNSTRAARQRAYEKSHDGSTFWGRNFAAGGAARTVDEFDRELESYKYFAEQASIIKDELKKDVNVQQAYAEKEALMKTGTATAAQIQAADYKIKSFEEIALQNEMTKISTGARGANYTIQRALKNAEAKQKEGLKRGYNGYKNGDIMNYATDFLDNKKSTSNETNEITGAGGSKNAEYRKAKANSKYNKSGK